MRNVTSAPRAWQGFMRYAFVAVVLLALCVNVFAEDVEAPADEAMTQLSDSLRFLGVDDPYRVLHESSIFHRLIAEELGRPDVLEHLEDASLERYYDARDRFDQSFSEMYLDPARADLFLLAAQIVGEQAEHHAEVEAAAVDTMRETADFLGHMDDPLQLLANDYNAIMQLHAQDEERAMQLIVFLETYDWLLGDPASEHWLQQQMAALLGEHSAIEVSALVGRLVQQEQYWATLCDEDDAACTDEAKTEHKHKHANTDDAKEIKPETKEKPLGKNKMAHGHKPANAQGKMKSGKTHKTPNGSEKHAGSSGGQGMPFPPGSSNTPTPQPNVGSGSSGSSTPKVVVSGNEKAIVKHTDVGPSTGNEGGSVTGGGIKTSGPVGQGTSTPTTDENGNSDGSGVFPVDENGEPPVLIIEDDSTPEGTQTGVATTLPNVGNDVGSHQGVNPHMTHFTPKDFNPRINTGGEPGTLGKTSSKHYVVEHDDDPTGQGHTINPGDKTPSKGAKQMNRGHKYKKTRKEMLTNPSPNAKQKAAKNMKAKKSKKKKKTKHPKKSG